MDLADEESGVPEPEIGPEWPAWSGYIRQAWNTLRDDRFYGAMGGMGTIYYTSASLYAMNNNIPVEPFLTFLRAMDDVFMAVSAETAKEKADSAETKE